MTSSDGAFDAMIAHREHYGRCLDCEAGEPHACLILSRRERREHICRTDELLCRNYEAHDYAGGERGKPASNPESPTGREPVGHTAKSPPVFRSLPPSGTAVHSGEAES